MPCTKVERQNYYATTVFFLLYLVKAETDSIRLFQGTAESVLTNQLMHLFLQPIPPTRIDTTARVVKLRQKMAAKNLAALIVLTGDEHEV